jgi:hypothetical protein
MLYLEQQLSNKACLQAMRIKLNILIFSFLWFSVTSFAQQNFKGDYTFNGLSGEAAFKYREGADQAMILNGDFRFERRQKDTEDGSVFYKTIANGTFLNNNRHGKWRFLEEKHQVALLDVTNFEVVADLDSKQTLIHGSYSNGVPNGIWNFTERVLKDKKLQLRSEVERMLFKDGYVQGQFQYKLFDNGRTFFVRGQLSDDGFMDGEWSLVYEIEEMLISEVRRYENGFLLGLVKRNLDTNEIIDEVVYHGTIEKINNLKEKKNVEYIVSENRFGVRYNDGFRKRFKEYQVQLPGNAFIENFLKQVLQFEKGEYINDDGDLIRYPLGTRRFAYPLSKQDRQRIEEIPGIFAELQKITNTYADMSALSLNKSKSDSLTFVHEFFQFNKDKLAQFENLIDVIRSGRIEYYDIRNYTQDGLEYIRKSDTIRYTYLGDQREKAVLSRKVMESYENFLGDFSEYLTDELALVRELGEYVEGQLSEVQQQQSLEKLERTIVDRRTEVDSLYIGHEPIHNREAELLMRLRYNILQAGIDSIIEQYGAAETYPERVSFSDQILENLDKMEAHFENVIRIYPALDKLDELYQEEFFNPFTYARYNQRVKERLYEFGGIRLYHYYLEQMKREQDYQAISDWIAKIERLHQRMLELRNADTRKLERRLKPDSSVGRIESLLEL